MNEEEARAFFHKLIHETCGHIRRKRQEAKEDSQYIREVMQYVQENYQDPDLNVSITALHFKITPSYLSALFKDQTGVSLLEYHQHHPGREDQGAVEGGDEHRGDLPPGRLSQQRGTDTRVQKRDRDHARTDEKTEQVGWLQDNECCKIC